MPERADAMQYKLLIPPPLTSAGDLYGRLSAADDTGRTAQGPALENNLLGDTHVDPSGLTSVSFQTRSQYQAVIAELPGLPDRGRAGLGIAANHHVMGSAKNRVARLRCFRNLSGQPGFDSTANGSGNLPGYSQPLQDGLTV